MRLQVRPSPVHIPPHPEPASQPKAPEAILENDDIIAHVFVSFRSRAARPRMAPDNYDKNFGIPVITPYASARTQTVNPCVFRM